MARKKTKTKKENKKMSATATEEVKKMDTQTEAEQLFDKMFFKKEKAPDFDEMFQVFVKSHPDATIKEAFDSAIRLGWGLAKIQQ
jgi:hypothetical protein